MESLNDEDTDSNISDFVDNFCSESNDSQKTLQLDEPGAPDFFQTQNIVYPKPFHSVHNRVETEVQHDRNSNLNSTATVNTLYYNSLTKKFSKEPCNAHATTSEYAPFSSTAGASVNNVTRSCSLEPYLPEIVPPSTSQSLDQGENTARKLCPKLKLRNYLPLSVDPFSLNKEQVHMSLVQTQKVIDALKLDLSMRQTTNLTKYICEDSDAVTLHNEVDTQTANTVQPQEPPGDDSSQHSNISDSKSSSESSSASSSSSSSTHSSPRSTSSRGARNVDKGQRQHVTRFNAEQSASPPTENCTGIYKSAEISQQRNRGNAANSPTNQSTSSPEAQLRKESIFAAHAQQTKRATDFLQNLSQTTESITGCADDEGDSNIALTRYLRDLETRPQSIPSDQIIKENTSEFANLILFEAHDTAAVPSESDLQNEQNETAKNGVSSVRTPTIHTSERSGRQVSSLCNHNLTLSTSSEQDAKRPGVDSEDFVNRSTTFRTAADTNLFQTTHKGRCETSTNRNTNFDSNAGRPAPAFPDTERTRNSEVSSTTPVTQVVHQGSTQKSTNESAKQNVRDLIARANRRLIEYLQQHYSARQRFDGNNINTKNDLDAALREVDKDVTNVKKTMQDLIEARKRLTTRKYELIIEGLKLAQTKAKTDCTRLNTNFRNEFEKKRRALRATLEVQYSKKMIPAAEKTDLISRQAEEIANYKSQILLDLNSFCAPFSKQKKLEYRGQLQQVFDKYHAEVNPKQSNFSSTPALVSEYSRTQQTIPTTSSSNISTVATHVEQKVYDIVRNTRTRVTAEVRKQVEDLSSGGSIHDMIGETAIAEEVALEENLGRIHECKTSFDEQHNLSTVARRRASNSKRNKREICRDNAFVPDDRDLNLPYVSAVTTIVQGQPETTPQDGPPDKKNRRSYRRKEPVSETITFGSKRK